MTSLAGVSLEIGLAYSPTFRSGASNVSALPCGLSVFPHAGVAQTGGRGWIPGTDLSGALEYGCERI